MLKNLGAGPGSKLERQWRNVANSCLSGGGEEVSCIKQANSVVQRAAGRNTLSHMPMAISEDELAGATEGTDTVTGRPILSIPATFTRQGVMNKSFKAWEELEKSFWTLERKPIISPTHPPEGEPITSNVFDQLVGYVDRTHLQEQDTSVRGNMNYFLDHPWVEENREKIGTEQRSLSVGYYAFNELLEEAESFEGVTYNARDKVIYFDHVAHLVNVPAACPLPACGLMVNEEGYNMTEEKKTVTAEQFAVNLQNFIDASMTPTSTTGDAATTVTFTSPDINWVWPTTDTTDAAHPGDCPEGQHMVEGKCVDKDEDDEHDHDNCDCEKESLNSGDTLIKLDNMTEDNAPAGSEETTEAPKAPIVDVESKFLVAENTVLKDKLEKAEARLDKIEAEAKSHKEAQTERLREMALELNATFKIFTDEDITAMDEPTLGGVVQALQAKARPDLKEVMMGKDASADPYSSDYRYAPLTVFNKKEDR